MARINSKRQATPKREAQRSHEHTSSLLRELEGITNPNQKEEFVNCLNDLLRAVRTIPEFLPKESGRGTGLKSYVKQEADRIQVSDAGFARFMTLRRISTHDCNVRPDRGEIPVEVSDRITVAGSFQIEARDAVTGKVSAREYIFAPPQVETTPHSTKVGIKYYFIDHPHEDIVKFCGEVLITLESLVGRAYAV
jgi:hypothetical protein